jgi:hypothetical protein
MENSLHRSNGTRDVAQIVRGDRLVEAKPTGGQSMHGAGNDRSASAGALEAGPLVIGVMGISIPVGLIALACITGSVIVLVLAVLAMLCVGGTVLAFMFRLTSDPSVVEAAVAGE